ncbi:VOC family protein [Candidatus Dojkabacteria bacterium]|uniref:VOC family protein n=1 Tax=Candidatus Dojkabacteria bacterium TaxID=2099670 RepID=A0A955RJV2_9BACT|nr:VOC family protein [Candidatus Dojkabacteria bacterium]
MGNKQGKELIEYGRVDLSITDLETSVNFYVQVIGLTVLERTDKVAIVGVGDVELIALHEDAVRRFLSGYTDLYHLAIHVPSEDEFAKVLARFLRMNISFSPVDHIMSKALYLLDPDGITIEITLKTPERFSRYDMDRGNFQVIDSQGHIRGATEPLDIHQLLINKPDAEEESAVLSHGAKIGHVHLYVNDLTMNYRFYESLGFIDNLLSERIGFADLSANGDFKHRLAMNTWTSKGGVHSPKGNAGMKSFTITYTDKSLLDSSIKKHAVKEVDNGYEILDPSGNTIRIAY